MRLNVYCGNLLWQSVLTLPRSDTYAYLYNVRSELTNATAAVDVAYRYGYDFDDIGNRASSFERGTNSAYAANNLNQYTSVDAFVPEYDADGNQTLVKTATGTWQVTYNGENRPILWTQGTNTISMSFDSMGRRVTKNDQCFVYNGYLQIADNAGNAYVWDPTEPVATRPLVWQRSALGTPHSALFYTHDGNKNVSEVLASDGSLAAHYEYAPFGALTVSRGTSAATNPWRFSSECAEDDTATVYYNCRHYEPEIGRWNGRDLLGEEIIWNLYFFCDNNPVNMYDVIGCLPQWINEIVKKAGYEFWGSFMVGDGAWKEMLDDWYYERGSSVRQYSDGSQQVEDIKNNAGFRKLINSSVAAQRGDDISSELNKCSPATSASAGSFYWHYAYPGKGNPAAGGSAAYQPVTHFLGSYGGTVTKESGGSVKSGLCRCKIRIQNTSGWTSGTRLPNFARNIGMSLRNRLPAWVGASNWDPVSLFKNHERGRNDLYPISRRSKGGNFNQSYTFIYETDCCASCELP